MTTDITVSRFDYPPMLKLVNQLARLVGQFGLPFTKLDPEGIIASAINTSGLRDFGSDDFMEPLGIMLEDARELPLTPLAKIAMRQVVVEALVRRLRLVEYRDQHPSLESVPIERPIFVLGFPRTGTTMLQNLLCRHTGRRALEFWELTNPIPVHTDPVRDERKRRRSAAFMIALSDLFAPEQAAVHDVRVDTPEECWYLFTSSLSALGWYLQSRMPRYGAWLMRQDMVPAYQRYRRHLQVLALNAPETPLVLKCPEHLWFLDSLLEVFPDACIVWTHRDPLSSIASYCSMTTMLNRTLYGRVNPPELGDHLLHCFEDGAARAMRVREHLRNPRQILDISFQELTQDPTATTRRICDHFGLPFSEEQGQDDWSRSRRDGQFTHKYDGEIYGITRERVDKRFADYMDRYNVRVRGH